MQFRVGPPSVSARLRGNFHTSSKGINPCVKLKNFLRESENVRRGTCVGGRASGNVRRINALHRPLTTDRPTEVLRRQLESFLGTFLNQSENGIDVAVVTSRRVQMSVQKNWRPKILATRFFRIFFCRNFFLSDVRRMSVGPLGDLYVG